MEYRNSVTSANGYLYNIVILGTIDELLGKDMPPFVHENEGTILIYDGHLIDVYGPDEEANSDISWRKSFGYPLFGESTYSYFSWDADEEIHINHNSPFIYYDSTHGEAATSGFVVTKIYTPNVTAINCSDDESTAELEYVASSELTRPAFVYVVSEDCNHFRKPDEDKTRTVGTTIVPMYAWHNTNESAATYYTESLTPEDGDANWCYDATQTPAWFTDGTVTDYTPEAKMSAWYEEDLGTFYADKRNPEADDYLWQPGTGGDWGQTDWYVMTQTWDESPFEGTAIRRVQSTAATNNVVKGGERFFQNCTSLSEVVMHNATYFGESCFAGCTALQYLYLNQHPCQVEATTFYNAGVTRGHIWAEGGTTPASWTIDNIPTILKDKYWVVHNTDDSAFSKGWDVTISDETSITHTINPALTVVSTYNFAQYNQDYTIAYTSSDPEVVVTGVEINGVVKSGASVVHRFTEDSWVQPCTAATVPVTVNFSPGGDWAPGSSVTGSGNYVPGSECTAAVTVGSGMTFQGWYDLYSATPHVPISTATSYTFRVPDGGCTITAALTHNTLAAITITNPDDAAVYMRHSADDRESSPKYAWTRYYDDDTIYTNQLAPVYGDTIYDAEGQSIGGHTVDHHFAHYAFYAWHQDSSFWPAYRAKDNTHDVTLDGVTYRAYQSEELDYFYINGQYDLDVLKWTYHYEGGSMSRYLRCKPFVIDCAGDRIFPEGATYRRRSMIASDYSGYDEQQGTEACGSYYLIGMDDSEYPFIWTWYTQPTPGSYECLNEFVRTRNLSDTGYNTLYDIDGRYAVGEVNYFDPNNYITGEHGDWLICMNTSAKHRQGFPYWGYTSEPPQPGYNYCWGLQGYTQSGWPQPGDLMYQPGLPDAYYRIAFCSNNPQPNDEVELKK